MSIEGATLCFFTERHS